MTANYLIVVGVDGSEGTSRALDWATREATARGGIVQAVVAWSWDGAKRGPCTAASQEQERAAQVLDREVTVRTTRHGSSLPVTVKVVEGRPADVLTEAGQAADLLVLGSRGDNQMSHTVPSSASQECIRKATCPVVVIPAAAAQPDPVSASMPVLRSSRPSARRSAIAPGQSTRPVSRMIRPSRGVW